MSQAKKVVASYRPLPPQRAFRNSTAKIRGYGGAMGGGKSRAICEEAFDLSLEHPGLKTVIARQEHTSITETTKKTMIEQVLPRELVRHTKQSGGEDYVELLNGSRIHFIGLDRPGRWFSSELGLLVVDQVEECSEDTIVLLTTRLRQVLPDGTVAPNKVILSFNPENPGHWLQRWFILGASRTEYGFYKRELWTTGAIAPLGDAEFIFAKAVDNPYLPPGYVELTLGGLPEHIRRRMLDGEWLFTSGHCFFDTQALQDYQTELRRPVYVGDTAGDITGEDPKDRVRLRPGREGPWQVWKPPVRERVENNRILPAHRYIATVDVSSGGSTDFSAIQVLDLENFEQVAEYQNKLDPDLLAVEAFRIGRIYNNALVAPEITGGWGFTLISELTRLRYPKLYTRRIEDRRSKKWTDKLGWDTTTKTRYVMLDTLERVIRERELKLVGERTLAELVTFVRPKRTMAGRDGKPEAQPGTNDDLVVTLAMAVTIAAQLPREVRRVKQEEYVPQFAATGW